MIISSSRISSLNEFRYNLPYEEMTGGAISISSSQFLKVNGFSNKFYGWGGEDDEFYQRLSHHHLEPVRYPPHVAQYVSMKHVKQAQRSNIDVDSGTSDYSKSDGLDNLNYSVSNLKQFEDFQLLQVYL